MRISKMKQRIISGALAFAMIVGIMPQQAFATNTYNSNSVYTNDIDTMIENGDIIIDGDVVINGESYSSDTPDLLETIDLVEDDGVSAINSDAPTLSDTQINAMTTLDVSTQMYYITSNGVYSDATFTTLVSGANPNGYNLTTSNEAVQYGVVVYTDTKILFDGVTMSSAPSVLTVISPDAPESTYDTSKSIHCEVYFRGQNTLYAKYAVYGQASGANYWTDHHPAIRLQNYGSVSFQSVDGTTDHSFEIYSETNTATIGGLNRVRGTGGNFTTTTYVGDITFNSGDIILNNQVGGGVVLGSQGYTASYAAAQNFLGNIVFNGGRVRLASSTGNNAIQMTSLIYGNTYFNGGEVNIAGGASAIVVQPTSIQAGFAFQSDDVILRLASNSSTLVGDENLSDLTNLRVNRGLSVIAGATDAIMNVNDLRIYEYHKGNSYTLNAETFGANPNLFYTTSFYDSTIEPGTYQIYQVPGVTINILETYKYMSGVTSGADEGTEPLTKFYVPTAKNQKTTYESAVKTIYGLDNLDLSEGYLEFSPEGMRQAQDYTFSYNGVEGGLAFNADSIDLATTINQSEPDVLPGGQTVENITKYTIKANDTTKTGKEYFYDWSLNLLRIEAKEDSPIPIEIDGPENHYIAINAKTGTNELTAYETGENPAISATSGIGMTIKGESSSNMYINGSPSKGEGLYIEGPIVLESNVYIKAIPGAGAHGIYVKDNDLSLSGATLTSVSDPDMEPIKYRQLYTSQYLFHGELRDDAINQDAWNTYTIKNSGNEMWQIDMPTGFKKMTQTASYDIYRLYRDDGKEMATNAYRDAVKMSVIDRGYNNFIDLAPVENTDEEKYTIYLSDGHIQFIDGGYIQTLHPGYTGGFDGLVPMPMELDGNGNTKEYTIKQKRDSESEDFYGQTGNGIWFGSEKVGYEDSFDGEYNVTLSNVNINMYNRVVKLDGTVDTTLKAYAFSPIRVHDGATANLMLQGGTTNYLDPYEFGNGIVVQKGGTVTIDGDGTLNIGKNNIYAPVSNSSGIGIGSFSAGTSEVTSDVMHAYGNIIIKNGNINIQSGYAAIGTESTNLTVQESRIELLGGNIDLETRHGSKYSINTGAMSVKTLKIMREADLLMKAHSPASVIYGDPITIDSTARIFSYSASGWTQNNGVTNQKIIGGNQQYLVSYGDYRTFTAIGLTVDGMDENDQNGDRGLEGSFTLVDSNAGLHLYRSSDITANPGDRGVSTYQYFNGLGLSDTHTWSPYGYYTEVTLDVAHGHIEIKEDGWRQHKDKDQLENEQWINVELGTTYYIIQTYETVTSGVYAPTTVPYTIEVVDDSSQYFTFARRIDIQAEGDLPALSSRGHVEIYVNNTTPYTAHVNTDVYLRADQAPGIDVGSLKITQHTATEENYDAFVVTTNLKGQKAVVTDSMNMEDGSRNMLNVNFLEAITEEEVGSGMRELWTIQSRLYTGVNPYNRAKRIYIGEGAYGVATLGIVGNEIRLYTKHGDTFFVDENDNGMFPSNGNDRLMNYDNLRYNDLESELWINMGHIRIEDGGYRQASTVSGLDRAELIKNDSNIYTISQNYTDSENVVNANRESVYTIEVASNVECDITLNGINIYQARIGGYMSYYPSTTSTTISYSGLVAEYQRPTFNIAKGASVNLTLADGTSNTLEALSSVNPAIYLPYNTTYGGKETALTIDGEGYLYANGAANQAGIGGLYIGEAIASFNEGRGALTINSGNIKLRSGTTGSTYATGIGVNTSNVVPMSGDFTMTGGYLDSDITQFGGTISILGGEVVTPGQTRGASIGQGPVYSANAAYDTSAISGNELEIYIGGDAKVTATVSSSYFNYQATIGGAYLTNTTDKTGLGTPKITITDNAVVTAYNDSPDNHGASIGGAYFVDNKEIIIDGNAKVTAGSTTNNATAIGGGRGNGTKGGDSGIITIGGNANVIAFSSSYSATIGGGASLGGASAGNANNITIKDNAVVYARSSSYGRAIGGGSTNHYYGGTAENISILSTSESKEGYPKVEAIGGIGGGSAENHAIALSGGLQNFEMTGGTLTITPSSNGIMYGAGLGAGSIGVAYNANPIGTSGDVTSIKITGNSVVNVEATNLGAAIGNAQGGDVGGAPAVYIEDTVSLTATSGRDNMAAITLAGGTLASGSTPIYMGTFRDETAKEFQVTGSTMKTPIAVKTMTGNEHFAVSVPKATGDTINRVQVENISGTQYYEDDLGRFIWDMKNSEATSAIDLHVEETSGAINLSKGYVKIVRELVDTADGQEWTLGYYQSVDPTFNGAILRKWETGNFVITNGATGYTVVVDAKEMDGEPNPSITLRDIYINMNENIDEEPLTVPIDIKAGTSNLAINFEGTSNITTYGEGNDAIKLNGDGQLNINSGTGSINIRLSGGAKAVSGENIMIDPGADFRVYHDGTDLDVFDISNQTGDATILQGRFEEIMDDQDSMSFTLYSPGKQYADMAMPAGYKGFAKTVVAGNYYIYQNSDYLYYACRPEGEPAGTPANESSVTIEDTIHNVPNGVETNKDNLFKTQWGVGYIDLAQGHVEITSTGYRQSRDFEFSDVEVLAFDNSRTISIYQSKPETSTPFIVKISGGASNNHRKINIMSDINVDLSEAQVSTQSPFYLSGYTTLSLNDNDVKVVANTNGAGIQFESNSTYLYVNGPGHLNATGGSAGGAGIGSTAVTGLGYMYFNGTGASLASLEAYSTGTVSAAVNVIAAPNAPHYLFRGTFLDPVTNIIRQQVKVIDPSENGSSVELILPKGYSSFATTVEKASTYNVMVPAIDSNKFYWTDGTYVSDFTITTNYQTPFTNLTLSDVGIGVLDIAQGYIRIADGEYQQSTNAGFTTGTKIKYDGDYQIIQSNTTSGYNITVESGEYSDNDLRIQLIGLNTVSPSSRAVVNIEDMLAYTDIDLVLSGTLNGSNNPAIYAGENANLNITGGGNLNGGSANSAIYAKENISFGGSDIQLIGGATSGHGIHSEKTVTFESGSLIKSIGTGYGLAVYGAENVKLAGGSSIYTIAGSTTDANGNYPMAIATSRVDDENSEIIHKDGAIETHQLANITAFTKDSVSAPVVLKGDQTHVYILDGYFEIPFSADHNVTIADLGTNPAELLNKTEITIPANYQRFAQSVDYADGYEIQETEELVYADIDENIEFAVNKTGITYAESLRLLGAPISGNIYLDRNYNGGIDISDTADIALEGITVTLYQSNGITPAYKDGVIITSTTGSDGSYILMAPENGDYVVGIDLNQTYTDNDEQTHKIIPDGRALIAQGNSSILSQITAKSNVITVEGVAVLNQNIGFNDEVTFILKDANGNIIRDKDETILDVLIPANNTVSLIQGDTAPYTIEISPDYIQNEEVLVLSGVKTPIVTHDLSDYVTASSTTGTLTITAKDLELSNGEITLSLFSQQSSFAQLKLLVSVTGEAVRASTTEQHAYVGDTFRVSELKDYITFTNMSGADSVENLITKLEMYNVYKYNTETNEYEIDESGEDNFLFTDDDIGYYIIQYVGTSASGQDVLDATDNSIYIKQEFYVHGLPEFNTNNTNYHNRTKEEFDQLYVYDHKDDSSDDDGLKATFVQAQKESENIVSNLELSVTGFTMYNTNGTDTDGNPTGEHRTTVPINTTGKYQIVYEGKLPNTSGTVKMYRDYYLHGTPEINVSGFISLNSNAQENDKWTMEEVSKVLAENQQITLGTFNHVNKDGSYSTYNNDSIDFEITNGSEPDDSKPIKPSFKEDGLGEEYDPHMYIANIKDSSGNILAGGIPNVAGVYTMDLIFRDTLDNMGATDISDAWEYDKEKLYVENGIGHTVLSFSVQILSSTNNLPSVAPQVTGNFVTTDETTFSRTIVEESNVENVDMTSVTMPEYHGNIYKYTPNGDISLPDMILEQVRYSGAQIHDYDIESITNADVQSQARKALLDSVKITEMSATYPGESDITINYDENSDIENDFIGDDNFSDGLIGSVSKTPGVYIIGIEISDIVTTDSSYSVGEDKSTTTFVLTVHDDVKFTDTDGEEFKGAGQLYVGDGGTYLGETIYASYQDGSKPTETSLSVVIPEIKEIQPKDTRDLKYTSSHMITSTFATNRNEDVFVQDKAFVNDAITIDAITSPTRHATVDEVINLLEVINSGTIKGHVNKYTDVTVDGSTITATWTENVEVYPTIKVNDVDYNGLDEGYEDYDDYSLNEPGVKTIKYTATDDEEYQNKDNTISVDVRTVFSSLPVIEFSNVVSHDEDTNEYSIIVLSTDSEDAIISKIAANGYYIYGQGQQKTVIDLEYTIDTNAKTVTYKGETQSGYEITETVKYIAEEAPSVVIKAIDSQGNTLNTNLQTITTGLVIGYPYSVSAPYYQGHVLADGQDTTKTITEIKAGVNTVEFIYNVLNDGSDGYKVSFVASADGTYNSGSVTERVVPNGTNFATYGYKVPTLTAKSGMEFAYWYDVTTDPTDTDNRLSPEEVEVLNITKDIIFRPVFKMIGVDDENSDDYPNTAYKVTFTSDRNGTLNSLTTDIVVYIVEGEAIGTLEPVTAANTNHLFNGWTENDANGAKISSLASEVIEKESVYFANFPTYGEVVASSFVTITVRNETTEGGLLSQYTVTMSKALSADEANLTAQDVVGYEFYEVKSSNSADTVDNTNRKQINIGTPILDDRTITFVYQTLQRDVEIIAMNIKDSQNPIKLGEPDYTTVTVQGNKGEKISVTAPVINGYVLAEGVANVSEYTVVDTNNTVTFNYVPVVGNVLIKFVDNVTNLTITTKDITLAYDDKDIIIDQYQDDMYDLGWSLSYEQDKASLSYKNELQEVNYYFVKDTRDVVIRHLLDGTSNVPVASDTTLTGDAAARVGEIYTMQPPVVPNYTAVSNAYSAKVETTKDAGQDTLELTFYYTRNDDKTVMVTYKDGDGNELSDATSIVAAVGANVTATAKQIAGYTAIDNITEKTVTVSNSDNNLIEFAYEKTGYEIIVKTKLGETADATNHISVMVDKGATQSISVPYMAGYVLDAYQINDGSKIDVDHNNTGFNNVAITSSNNEDIVLTFHYITASEAAGGAFIAVQVIGQNNNNEQLYSYTINLPRPIVEGTEVGDIYYVLVNQVVGHNLTNLAVTGAELEGTADVSNRIYTFEPDSLMNITQALTLTATYEDLRREITVNAQDAQGFNISGFSPYTVNGTVGETLNIHPPVIEGYVLSSSYSNNSSYNVSSAEIQSVTYYYEALQSNSVIVVLREGTEEFPGNIIELRNGGDLSEFNPNITIDVPDLTDDYYTAVSGQQSVELTYSATESTPTVTFYYEKQTATVTVKYLCNDVEVQDTKTFEDIRLGETFTATAQALLEDYSLINDISKSVVITEDTEIIFEYKENAQKLLTIEHVDTANNKVLGTELVTAAEGSKITVNSSSFTGYELSSSSNSFVYTITDEDDQTVVFEYVKTGYEIFVYTNVGNGDVFVQSTMVDKNQNTYVTVPGVAGYVLSSYTVDGGIATSVPEDGSTTSVLISANGNPNEDRTIVFNYSPFGDFVAGQYVEITVYYEDQDAEQVHDPIKLTLSKDTDGVITALNLNLYKLTSASSTDTNGTFDVDAGTYTLSSLENNQTVVFKYEYQLREVKSIAYLEDGVTPVPGYDNANPIINSGSVGASIVIPAPVINGYILATGEEMSQTYTYTADYDQEVEFKYEVITGNVVIRMIESDTEVIIATEQANVAYGQSGVAIDIPDLTENGWKAVDTTEKTVNYQSGLQYVDYYYKKDTRDVIVKYVDEDGKEIQSQTTYYGDARVSETYTLTPPEITGYIAPIGYNEVVEAGTDAITITFVYTESTQRAITVQYKYGSEILATDTLYAAEKSVVTATAKEFKGYTAQAPTTQKFTVTANNENNVITFNYDKTGYEITVYMQKGSSTAEIYGETIMLDQGEDFEMSAPTVSGYSFMGYTWADEEPVRFERPNEESVITKTPTDDTVFILYYLDSSEAVKGYFSTVNVINKDAAGTIISEYTLQLSKEGGVNTVNAQNIPGYVVGSAEITTTGGQEVGSYTNGVATLPQDLEDNYIVIFNYKLSDLGGGGYTINFLSSENGSVTGNTTKFENISHGSTLIEYGYDVPETTADTGYALYAWLSAETGETYTKDEILNKSIEMDETFVALFKGGIINPEDTTGPLIPDPSEDDHEIVAISFNVQGNGSFGAGVLSKTIYFAETEILGELVPTPVAGSYSAFTGWYDGTLEIGNTDTLKQVVAQENKVYTARFVDDYNENGVDDNEETKYTVSFTSTTGGTIENRTYEIVEGASLSAYGYIVPTPNATGLYEFIYFYDASKNPTIASNQLTSENVLVSKITANTIFVAVFIEDDGNALTPPSEEDYPKETFKIDFLVSSKGNGSISSPTVIYVVKGETLNGLVPTATPDEGYLFDKWTKSTESGEEIANVSSEVINFSTSYYAHFATLDEIIASKYSTITIIGVDSEGETLYTFETKVEKIATGDEKVFASQVVPYYEYVKATVTGDNGPYGFTDIDGTVTLSSLAENQTITFEYASLKREITVTAVLRDGEGSETTQTYIVEGYKGETLNIYAQAVEGYIVDTTEATFVAHEVQDSNNEVIFYYDIITGNIVIKLVDEDTNLIIEIRQATLESGGELVLTPPSLGDTWVANANQEVTVNDSNKDEEIIFYYNRPTRNIEINHYFVGTEEKVKDTETKTAKVGETFTASADSSIEGYIISGTPIWSQVVELSSETLVINFYYDTLNVNPDPTTYKVEYHYDGQLISGKSYTLMGTVDQVVSYPADASFTIGVNEYVLTSDVNQTITLVADASQNVLVYNYTRTELATLSEWTVNYVFNGTTLQTFTGKEMSGTEFTHTASSFEQDGYRYVLANDEPASKTITMSKTNSENTITFNFTSEVLTYKTTWSTKYLYNNVEVKVDSFAGETEEIVTHTPLEMFDAGGYRYTLISGQPESKELKLTANTATNVITYNYERGDIPRSVSYEIVYLYNNEVMKTTKEVAILGDLVSFDAVESFIIGKYEYKLSDDATKSMTIVDADEDNMADIRLEFNFERFDAPLNVSYDVIYKYDGIEIKTSTFVGKIGETATHEAVYEFTEGNYYYILDDTQVKSIVLVDNNDDDKADDKLEFNYIRGELERQITWETKYMVDEEEVRVFTEFASVGNTVSHTAPLTFIDGNFYYILDDTEIKTVTLTDTDEDYKADQVLVFNYIREDLSRAIAWEVIYMYEDQEIRTITSVSNIGEVVSHNAVNSFIEGNYKYTLDDESSKSIVITDDDSDNYADEKLIFVYTREIIETNTGTNTGTTTTVGVPKVTVIYFEGYFGELVGNRTELVTVGKTPTTVPEIIPIDGFTFAGFSIDRETIVNPLEVNVRETTEFIAMYYDEFGNLIPGDYNEIGEHIAYLYGDLAGTFRADDSIKRSEVLAMFSRLLETPMPEDYKGTSSFSDIDPNAWYANIIAYMEHFGIVKGYEDGTFKPEQTMTRAEFVTVVFRFMRAEFKTSNGFPDVDESHWAYAYIETSQVNGWVIGDQNGNFNPDNNLTRAEAATVVNRILDRFADKNYIDRYSVKSYSDLNDSHWGYYDIMEASNEHTYYYVNNNSGEVWIKVN